MDSLKPFLQALSEDKKQIFIQNLAVVGADFIQ